MPLPLWQKLDYALRTRGVTGTMRLLGSYGRWYWHKYRDADRRFLVTCDGYRMYVNLDDPGLSTTIGRGGTRERAHTLVLQRALRPGMKVLDIGANLGFYALMEAALIGPEGHVWALEPVPQNFEILQANIALNRWEDRVTALPYAMSDHSGEQTLFLSTFSNLNTLFHFQLRDNGTESGETIVVSTLDLASFCREYGPVDFIRMDIEGAEVEVLNGLADGMADGGSRPSVLFEVHRKAYREEAHDIHRPLQRLFAAGYRPTRMISNQDSGNKWQEWGYRPSELVPTDGTVRGIYHDMKPEHALELIAHRGGVRAALLQPEEEKDSQRTQDWR